MTKIIEPGRTTRCEYCGTELIGRGRRRRFCSTACRDNYHRKPGLTAHGLNHHGYAIAKAWRNGKRVMVLEHRWLLEQYLGRRLRPAETVHHINSDRTDNRIENLRLYPSMSAHMRAEHAHRGRRERVVQPKSGASAPPNLRKSRDDVI